MTSAIRRPTPRPTYDHPTVIRHADAARHLWGDPGGSGYVSDQVYVSSSDLHVLQYTLGPRGRFVHSAANPTVFGADVAYVVLSGELILVDPEHGEVRPVRAGEAGFFRRDTWHHGINPGGEPLRVLEFFAPPPSRDTASPYARSRPLLEETRYSDDRWAGRWPQAAAERAATARLHVARESDLLYSLPEPDGGHLLGTAVDTEHLHVGAGRLSPGHGGDVHTAEHETVFYVTEGSVYLHLPEYEGPAWHRMDVDDAGYLPAGTPYRLVDMEGRGARYWVGAGKPVPEGWRP